LAKNETTATAMASKSVEQQQQQQQLQWQKATGNKLPGNTHAPPKVMFVPQRRHLNIHIVGGSTANATLQQQQQQQELQQQHKAICSHTARKLTRKLC